MIAVVPVRDGVLPAGGAEAAAEAGGRSVVVGAGAVGAAAALAGAATSVIAWEEKGFAPARWAAGLVSLLSAEPAVVLPGSPDGRDLAPRLAAALDRPLHAGAVAVGTDRVNVARHGGRSIERVIVTRPFVATLQAGSRGVAADPDASAPTVETVELGFGSDAVSAPPDAEVLEVLAPDAATVDLAEARRIVAGGGGLDGPDRFVQLAAIARAVNASLGATRVVTDKGWADHGRQIGTTGVAVDPRLYVALAISGAVQHVNGIGTPEHIISVNRDPHCPMMALAHLAIVCDANALLDELLVRLGVERG